MATDHIILSAALDGAGWHPAAWREPAAQPADLFTAGYWTDLAATAERGLLDLVTIEDSFSLDADNLTRPESRTDRVRGRLDAVQIAARVAPTTTSLGFIPTVITTHTEPFHISKAVATLDYVSNGRAGVRVQVAGRPDVAAHFGRRTLDPVERADADRVGESSAVADHFDEAADYVDVVRRLWDSWEDDAEIRDVATGRFVDRNKLHYIDFRGRWFTVTGPSITPRPPQGQPVVAALGHAAIPYRLIASSADVGFITPHDAAEARRIIAQINRFQEDVDRTDEQIRILADVVVVLGESADAAQERLAKLDEAAGQTYRSDALIVADTASNLADLLQEWRAAGVDGFRLRPAVLPDDLAAITDSLVPELQRRGVYRTSYPDGRVTLRSLLDLPRPANRYAAR